MSIVFNLNNNYASERRQCYQEHLPRVYMYDWKFGRKPPHHKWLHMERQYGPSGDYFMARYPSEDSPQRRAEVLADIAAIEAIRDDVAAQFDALIKMLRDDMLT